MDKIGKILINKNTFLMELMLYLRDRLKQGKSVK